MGQSSPITIFSSTYLNAELLKGLTKSYIILKVSVASVLNKSTSFEIIIVAYFHF